MKCHLPLWYLLSLGISEAFAFYFCGRTIWVEVKEFFNEK